MILIILMLKLTIVISFLKLSSAQFIPSNLGNEQIFDLPESFNQSRSYGGYEEPIWPSVLTPELPPPNSMVDPNQELMFGDEDLLEESHLGRATEMDNFGHIWTKDCYVCESTFYCMETYTNITRRTMCLTNPDNNRRCCKLPCWYWATKVEERGSLHRLPCGIQHPEWFPRGKPWGRPGYNAGIDRKPMIGFMTSFIALLYFF